MRRRTLGVVGTLVWDRFVDPRGTAPPVEGWGGVAYALAALSASLPASWAVLPIVKLGSDLADSGRRFLARVPNVDASAVLEVPEANNRVALRYRNSDDRDERLTGGVPPWRWSELAPRVQRCDALYVNYVSGYETTLQTARSLAAGFRGPRYGDLHSLFLGKDAEGNRVPRPLPEAELWRSCFHAVQINEAELGLLTGSNDPWPLLPGLLVDRLRLVLVTRGARGATAAVGEDVAADPFTWVERDRAAAPARPFEARSVTMATERRAGDPTGCGDVWGATCFARLLAGDRLQDAMAEGNRLGGVNVEHRTAEGLLDRLEREPRFHPGIVSPRRAP